MKQHYKKELKDVVKDLRSQGKYFSMRSRLAKFAMGGAMVRVPKMPKVGFKTRLKGIASKAGNLLGTGYGKLRNVGQGLAKTKIGGAAIGAAKRIGGLVKSGFGAIRKKTGFSSGDYMINFAKTKRLKGKRTLKGYALKTAAGVGLGGALVGGALGNIADRASRGGGLGIAGGLGGALGGGAAGGLYGAGLGALGYGAIRGAEALRNRKKKKQASYSSSGDYLAQFAKTKQLKGKRKPTLKGHTIKGAGGGAVAGAALNGGLTYNIARKMGMGRAASAGLAAGAGAMGAIGGGIYGAGVGAATYGAKRGVSSLRNRKKGEQVSYSRDRNLVQFSTSKKLTGRRLN